MTRYERIAARIAAELNTDMVEVLVIIVARKPRAKKLPPRVIETTCEEVPPTRRAA